jgi:methionyl-tRNA formyltransferase
VVIGCLEETLDTLEIMRQLGEKPDYIITLTEEQAIKAEATNYVDISKWASKNGIPYSYVKSYNMKNEEDYQFIKTLNSDILIVLGWQRLIPNEILKCVKIGTIGFRGSCNFLPWRRGRSLINWSIIERRSRFILHMFFIIWRYYWHESF